jgi:hypothetical protein
MLGVMTALTSPSISSFVIRFVYDQREKDDTGQPTYHGSIRHIQSDEEINFTSWQEAEIFIRRFVPLEEKHT